MYMYSICVIIHIIIHVHCTSIHVHVLSYLCVHVCGIIVNSQE